MPTPNLLKTAIRLHEKKFKLQNRLLAPYESVKGDITLYLLKRGGSNGKKFKVLGTYQNFGFDTENTLLRSRPYFELAKTDQETGFLIGQATHIAVVPNGEIYSIREGEEVQSQQTDWTYKIFGQLTGQRFNAQTDV